MDIRNLVARIKLTRFLKVPSVAAGVLAIAVVGGAYYFFVYQLQEQGQSPTPVSSAPVSRNPMPSPIASNPQPGNPQPGNPQPGLAQAPAKPVVAQPAAPVASTPPVVTEEMQPPVAQAPGAAAPETVAKAAEFDTVAQKPEQQGRAGEGSAKEADKRELAAKPEQIADLDTKADVQDTSRHVPPQPEDVLLKPAYPSDEPATSSAPSEPVSVPPAEPAPLPAPMPASPEPAESLQVAPVQAGPVSGVITPKYNDIMTAVLRSDRQAAKELLDLGWWVDKPSASGVTPLMAAVMNRDAEMVRLLLEYGAEPTAQALRLARKNKDTATAALLEEKGARY